MKLFLIVSTLLVLLDFNADAQSNFQKGKVIFNNGDTTYGWIDYRNWDINPEFIDFKKDSSIGTSNTYTVKDLSGFEIANKDSYVKAAVIKDMREVNLSQLKDGRLENSIPDTLFLRTLVKGKHLNLYVFTDFKKHFYIEQEPGKFQELLFKLYRIDNTVETRAIYKDQLKVYSAIPGTDKRLSEMIDRSTYNESSLTAIVVAINGGKETATYITQSPGNKITSTFFAGPGVSYSTIKMEGRNSSVNHIDFQSSVQPVLTAGIDLSPTRQRYGFRVELTYFSNNFKGEGTRLASGGIQQEVIYNIKQNNFSPSLGFLYNILNASSKIYVGASLACNFSRYTENKYMAKNYLTNEYEDQGAYLDLQKAWLSVNLRAGLIISKRFELAMLGSVSGNFSNYSSVGVKPSLFMATINYRIRKNR